MKIKIALPLLKKIINKPFKQIFKEYNIKDIKVNKGLTGNLLQKIIGLPLNSKLLDFEDGELKTNKSDFEGNPKETMFISQISNNVDSLLERIDFIDFWIYKKIKRLIYLPVVKEEKDPLEWYFQNCHFIDLSSDSELFEQLRDDFYSICKQMIEHIEKKDGWLHTSNGKLIQIRTKDSKPYSPIYSTKYSKYISNKNFAFYFKKNFMRYIKDKND